MICDNNQTNIINTIKQIVNEEITSRATEKTGSQIQQQISKHIQSWTEETLNCVMRGALTNGIITIIKTHTVSTTQKKTIQSILNRILRSLEKIWIQ